MARFIVVTMLLASATAVAAPAKLGYQGRLLKTDGTPETGTPTVNFALFGAATGGADLWNEDQVVGLTEGYFAVYLGSVKPFPAGLFDGTERFLEITLAGSKLAPRQRVASVAYALSSDEAKNLVGGKVDATSISVNGTTIVDASGKIAASALSVPLDSLTDVDTSTLPPATGDLLAWNGTAWAPAGRLFSSMASGGGADAFQTTAPVEVDVPIPARARFAALNTICNIASSDGTGKSAQATFAFLSAGGGALYGGTGCYAHTGDPAGVSLVQDHVFPVPQGATTLRLKAAITESDTGFRRANVSATFMLQ